VPIVDVVHPQNDATDQELVLPGQIMPFTDTPIYARTKRWYFDIGAHVRQGRLLAQIETPELDAQLRQAHADLDTAQANARLAGITAQRTENLIKSQSVFDPGSRQCGRCQQRRPGDRCVTTGRSRAAGGDAIL
jgi:multidrug efflux pump subunit AcrA (membrane-fusion protein)